MIFAVTATVDAVKAPLRLNSDLITPKRLAEIVDHERWGASAR
jgi:hypothetical protein